MGLRRMIWLLVIGSLRVMPAQGVVLALAYLLESQHAARSAIGAVQSAFMAGIGGGGVICAARAVSTLGAASLVVDAPGRSAAAGLLRRCGRLVVIRNGERRRLARPGHAGVH